VSDALPAAPGSYLLWFHLDQPRSLQVGRHGGVVLRAGWYGYVGSAFGPGGLRARVGRHLRGAQRRRWHVDYLRAEVPVERVWFVCGMRLEHAWAAALHGHAGASAVPGFGASDCACRSHLYRFARRPAPAVLGDLGTPAGGLCICRTGSPFQSGNEPER
jgi:Uri superfamily endonuclease